MIFHACTTTTDPATERAAILRLQKQEQMAHLQYNADSFVSMMADDFTSIDAGKITHPTREENRTRFARYFSRVHFLAWEDITPPSITIANDASLAIVLVHKRLIVVPKDSLSARPDTAIFAWSAHYRKYDGEWKIFTVVSTNKP